MKLALRLAFCGFLIEVLFCSFWLLDDKFNFFDLPTVEQAAKIPGNYSQPALRSRLETANFVVCPPLVITIVGMDWDTAGNIGLDLIAALLNALLYFAVAAAVAKSRNAIMRRRARSTG